MSTLRVNTIQDTAGSGSPAINGLARAWVNFNGTGTVAIRAASNVSSITDNGTGDYTVNFSTAMPDANYACCGMIKPQSGQTDQSRARAINIRYDQNPTTSNVRIITVTSGASAEDGDFATFAVFR